CAGVFPHTSSYPERVNARTGGSHDPYRRVTTRDRTGSGMQEVSMLCSRLGTVPRASLALLAWAGLGIHSVSTAAGSEPAPAVRAADALLPVSGVDVRADLELGEVVVGIRTPFGVTPVRPAVFVAQRFNWETQRPDVRAPRALYDLDFSTTIDADPEAAEAVDAAVLLNQGSARLAPGPDADIMGLVISHD